MYWVKRVCMLLLLIFCKINKLIIKDEVISKQENIGS
jgi:hypothetical protein